jgi:hypothetical protein
MALLHTRRAALTTRGFFLLMIVPMIAWGQTLHPQSPALHHAFNSSSPSSNSDNTDSDVESDLDSCRVHRVTSLPGSHRFASDFIEAIASDPDPAAKDPDALWGLTADLSNEVAPQNQALYISKSTNGGATWSQVARVDSRYFDAKIGEGLRNGFSVSPGGDYFIITTQRGAFQVVPHPATSETVVKPIVGPRVPDTPPRLPIPKK